MERLRRKTLPAWPDPMDSLGQKVNTRTRRIGRSSVWFPRGPALEKYNEVIRAEVEGVLNNIELPEGERLIVKLYMMGRSEQKANPIVMICCPDRTTRKEAEALIRESKLLEREENRGFGLGSTGFPLETNFLLRPLGKGIHLNNNPTTGAELRVDVYGLSEPGIGRKLSFVASTQDSRSVRYATGGPIVYLGNRSYQLTVAHAAKLNPGSKSTQEQASDTDECEFDGQSDDDDDDDDDEHMILSRGSVSPGWPMRDSDHESDQQKSQQSSTFSDSYPETPDLGRFQIPKISTPQMPPNLMEMDEEFSQWMKSPANSSTLLGSFPMPDRFGGELDYLLINLPEDYPWLAKGLNEVKLQESLRSRSVYVQDIGSTNNTDVSILAITSRGPIRGNILADAVSFKTHKSCSFQQLLTVLLSEGLREGDSGSALIDAQTGNFYGYVILGVDGDCAAYALPSPMIMGKITTHYGQLPSFRPPNEHGSLSSLPTARAYPGGNPIRQAGPLSDSSSMLSIFEDASQSSTYTALSSGRHRSLQKDLWDTRLEVQRLNTELRNTWSELNIAQQSSEIDYRNIEMGNDFGEHHIGTIKTSDGVQVDAVPQRVLVEWHDPTSVNPGQDNNDGQKFVEYISRLSTLLATEKPDSFHALTCRGFIRGRKLSLGLVFNLPGGNVKPVSLHDVITTCQKPKFHPFLEDKFRLAHALAEAVYHFHQVGWLHKRLRPSNIIFFAPHHSAIPKAGKFKAEDIKAEDTKAEELILNPYIVGFSHSRPNERDNFTEFSGDPRNAYCHPDYLRKGSSFRQEYDYYSLGLILFEIGQWHPVANVKHSSMEKMSPQQRRDEILQSRLHILRRTMGRTYYEVVKTCLDNDWTPDVHTFDSDHNQRVRESFHELVVCRLREVFRRLSGTEGVATPK